MRFAAGLARPGFVAPQTAGRTAASISVGSDSRSPSYLGESARIGYARVSSRSQDPRTQLDALAAAHCHEIFLETAGLSDSRPELRRTLGMLRLGDTLVIHKPDRIAGSVRQLLVLLEAQLLTRGINLHILSGVCAGLHRADGASIADKMLFMVAEMAAEMERDLIQEGTQGRLRPDDSIQMYRALGEDA